MNKLTTEQVENLLLKPTVLSLKNGDVFKLNPRSKRFYILKNMSLHAPKIPSTCVLLFCEDGTQMTVNKFANVIINKLC